MTSSSTRSQFMTWTEPTLLVIRSRSICQFVHVAIQLEDGLLVLFSAAYLGDSGSYLRRQRVAGEGY